MSLKSILAAIYQRPRHADSGKPTLARMCRLLAALGNPQERLPPIIHVTGTNGKTSVATMASAIITASGRRVGLYTSPYMTDFNERVRIDGLPIPTSELVAYAEHVQSVANACEASETDLRFLAFEVLTAMALCYFADQACDVLVVEVGIGGRFDSTNCLPTAKVAVLTSVAYDHQAVLGDTLAAITHQKIGIVHPQMTLVTSTLPAEAQAVVAQVAAPVIVVPADARYPTCLAGAFQEHNAALAVAAARCLLPDISKTVCYEGLQQATLQGRFELMSTADGRQVLLDGAHNAAGLMTLKTALQQRFPTQAVTCIVSSLAEKNTLSALASYPRHWPIVLVPFANTTGRAGWSLSDVQQAACHKNLSWSLDWQSALAASETAAVVITGSLYFVSAVRTTLLPK